MFFVDKKKYGVPDGVEIAVAESRPDILAFNQVTESMLCDLINPLLAVVCFDLHAAGADMESVSAMFGRPVTHLIAVWDMDKCMSAPWWDAVVAHEVGHIKRGHKLSFDEPTMKVQETEADAYAVSLGYKEEVRILLSEFMASKLATINPLLASVNKHRLQVL